MNIRYICKQCGGEAKYNPSQDKVMCESCGSSDFNYNIDEKCPTCGGELKYNENTNTIECCICDFKTTLDTVDTNTQEEQMEGNEAVCTGCGAHILIEDNTASFKCPYCDSIINVSKNIIGVAKPKYIIPFKNTRQDAEAAFSKWCKKGFFCPKDFQFSDRIKEIKPMYIPFWIYDLDNQGLMSFEARKVRHYSDSRYNYTETKYYQCDRNIKMRLLDLPCDASKKMDDKSMDLLEPFNLKDSKEFNIGYLSGTLTEKYDFTNEELLKRAIAKNKEFIIEYLKKDMSKNGFSLPVLRTDGTNVRTEKADYILLPVWIVSYNYKGEDIQFLMNGQTGKVVGKAPRSYPKIFGLGMTLAMIASILEMLIIF